MKTTHDTIGEALDHLLALARYGRPDRDVCAAAKRLSDHVAGSSRTTKIPGAPPADTATNSAIKTAQIDDLVLRVQKLTDANAHLSNRLDEVARKRTAALDDLTEAQGQNAELQQRFDDALRDRNHKEACLRSATVELQNERDLLAELRRVLG